MFPKCFPISNALCLSADKALRSMYCLKCFVLDCRWTGSNKNPLRYDGEGIGGSDRSNILLLASQVYPRDYIRSGVKQFGYAGRNYPARLNSTSFLGFTNDDRTKLALLTPSKYLLNTQRS